MTRNSAYATGHLLLVLQAAAIVAIDVDTGRATEATVRTADADYTKWQNVAIMLDRIFFWFFFVSICVALVACFVIVPAFNSSPQLDQDHADYVTE